MMISRVGRENVDLTVQCNLDQLESRLRTQLRGRVRDLNLFLHDDGLILRGTAETYHAKQLAQHTLMGQVDTPILANEIDVP